MIFILVNYWPIKSETVFCTMNCVFYYKNIEYLIFFGWFWLNLMYFDRRYYAYSIFGVFDQFWPFLEICTLTSFAYCGFAFFTHNAPISFCRWMKFIPELFLTQIYYFQRLFFEISRNLNDFLIFGLFKTIFRPLRHIVKYCKFTEISIPIRT